MASFFDDPETKVDDYWAAQNEAQKGVQVTEVSPPVAASGQAVQPTPASNPNVIANRTPAVTQNKQSYQIMEDIYSLPKPEYDATKASEIKRLSKINALSQGFNVLGDVFSLGMGANVNKRQPDTLPQQLWQYKQHYNDTYQQRMDQWRTQQAIQRIRGLERQQQMEWQQGQVERQQANANRQFNLAEESKKQSQENWDKQFKLNEKNIDADNKRQEEQFKKTMSLHYAQLERQKTADIQRAASRAATQKDGSMILYDEYRTPLYKLEKSEQSKVIGLILNDPATRELAKNDMVLMDAQYGTGMTALKMSNLIAQYYDKSPSVVKYLSGNEIKPETQPTTPSTGVFPERPGYSLQTTPQQQQPSSKVEPASDDFDIYKRK